MVAVAYKTGAVVAYERVFETVLTEKKKMVISTKWSLTGGGGLREVFARRELTVYTPRILIDTFFSLQGLPYIILYMYTPL